MGLNAEEGQGSVTPDVLSSLVSAGKKNEWARRVWPTQNLPGEEWRPVSDGHGDYWPGDR